MFERVNYLKYNQKKEGEQTENRLETHHTHFFFVDDGMTAARSVTNMNTDEQFRKRFEHFVSEELKTPIVVVLLQVNIFTLYYISVTRAYGRDFTIAVELQKIEFINVAKVKI